MKRFVALVLSIVFLTSCSVTGSSDTGMDSPAPEPLQIGQTIHIKNDYILKPEPQSFANVYEAIQRIVPGEQYVVNSRRVVYMEIESAVNSGWIPLWYLQNDDKVSNVQDEVILLVDKKTDLYLAPGVPEETDVPLSLEKGQAVRVKREYADWYDVEYVLYEAGNPGERWIKKDATIPFDPETCMEGYLKKGAFIYEEDFTVRAGDSFDNNPVRITNTRTHADSVYYAITGAGGFYGLIEASDFLPDPFARYPQW